MLETCNEVGWIAVDRREVTNACSAALDGLIF